MEAIEFQLQKWFGMSTQTFGQVVLIGAFTLFVAMIIIVSIIALIGDPSAANNASWGFAD